MLARKDAASLGKLRAEYLSYTASEIDYYSALHRQVFGHEIPHVMLLHANHLNAAVMDQILRLFEQRRYRFVTLDSAESDPAYRIPDTFATKYGRCGDIAGRRNEASRSRERSSPNRLRGSCITTRAPADRLEITEYGYG